MDRRINIWADRRNNANMVEISTTYKILLSSQSGIPLHDSQHEKKACLEMLGLCLHLSSADTVKFENGVTNYLMLVIVKYNLIYV